MVQSRLGIAAVLALTFVAGCGDDTTANTTDMAGLADLAQGGGGDMATGPQPSKKVIIFVWDGLRPDSVTQADTPNLYAMKQAGVDFSKNHSTYPTFTMMNGASFAT